MLGHKSATMTLDLYGHLFEDRLDVVADAMKKARLSAVSRDGGIVRDLVRDGAGVKQMTA